jgi:hypothetical protein
MSEARVGSPPQPTAPPCATAAPRATGWLVVAIAANAAMGFVSFDILRDPVAGWVYFGVAFAIAAAIAVAVVAARCGRG